jgi:hypothetical protein
VLTEKGSLAGSARSERISGAQLSAGLGGRKTSVRKLARGKTPSGATTRSEGAATWIATELAIATAALNPGAQLQLQLCESSAAVPLVLPSTE